MLPYERHREVAERIADHLSKWNDTLAQELRRGAFVTTIAPAPDGAALLNINFLGVVRAKGVIDSELDDLRKVAREAARKHGAALVELGKRRTSSNSSVWATMVLKVKKVEEAKPV